jgi:hypothetical protein
MWKIQVIYSTTEYTFTLAYFKILVGENISFVYEGD